MRTLVLWDIDHTLINAGGLSEEIYASVFHRLTGRAPAEIASMAGRTDRAITAETLHRHGVAPTPSLTSSFLDALASAYTARRAEPPDRGHVLSGARAALKALASRPDVIQSALTGNMRPIAECELTAFGLTDFFDLERPPLVKPAQQRASGKYGEQFTASNTDLVVDAILRT